MVHATVDDFIKFSNYQDLDDGEKAQIEMFLEQADGLISDYIGSDDWTIPANPGLKIRGDNGSTAIGRLLHIVKRYFDNQNFYTSESYDGISASVDESALDGIRLSDYDKQVLNRQRRQNSRISTKPLSRNNGYVW